MSAQDMAMGLCLSVFVFIAAFMVIFSHRILQLDKSQKTS